MRSRIDTKGTGVTNAVLLPLRVFSFKSSPAGAFSVFTTILQNE